MWFICATAAPTRSGAGRQQNSPISPRRCQQRANLKERQRELATQPQIATTSTVDVTLQIAIDFEASASVADGAASRPCRVPTQRLLVRVSRSSYLCVHELLQRQFFDFNERRACVCARAKHKNRFENQSWRI